MKHLKRILSCVIIMVLLLSQTNTIVFSLTDLEKQNFERIIGVYDGSYTATQGITGLTLSIYKTEDLLNDITLLQNYANIANSCSVTSSNETEKNFTAEDIKAIVSNHSDEYIALFNFFPMVNENEVGPNPDVEEGLYTMTITYNESTGKYDFIGNQWIQHDTYVFADLKNVVLTDDVLSGDVYGEYSSWFWTEYGDIGDVSVSSGKGHSGYRIEFENNSASIGVNEKQKIKAIVKNSDGILATDTANIRWFSNNENIARITGENWGDNNFDSATGVLTGVSEGITEVYAELDNKRISTCSVIVSNNGTIAPVEITTSHELVSQIITSTEGDIKTYRFAPHYKITSTIKNPDINRVDSVFVSLNLPDNAEIYGDSQLLTSIDNLGSNESKTLTWDIIVDADYYNLTEITYSVSAESDNFAEIFGYKTIFVDPFIGKDNRINFDSDVWNFTNSSVYFDKGHFINSEYYNSLIDSVSNIEKEKIDDYLNSPWNGSCYGMSVVSILTKMEHLTPSVYFSDASVLKELPFPKDNDEIYSLITYYHMSQILESYYASLHDKLSLDESQRLISLVNALEKVKVGDCPVVLSVQRMKKDYDIHSIETDYFEGHALVAYDIEYGSYDIISIVDGTSSTYDKRITIYDPNNNEAPRYMYINSDFSKWIIDGYCQNQTKDDGLYWYKGEGYFSFVNDINILDSINVEDSITNYHSRMITNSNTRLKVKLHNDNETFKEFDVQGVNIRKGLNDDIIPFVDGLLGDGVSTGFGYFLPNDTTGLTIEADSTGSVLDVSFENTGAFYSAKSQNGDTVTFSEQTSVEMNCNGEYTLTAIYNGDNVTTPWYSYSVTGTTDGTVSLSKDDNGYAMISGENLNGSELTVKGDSGEIIRTINLDIDNVLVKSEDNAVVLYTDTDNNGTFETNIDQINNICVGDANGDGNVNVKDATEIQKTVAGLLTLDDIEELAADVDASGKVNVKDATAIQKYLAGMKVDYPIGEQMSFGDLNGGSKDEYVCDKVVFDRQYHDSNEYAIISAYDESGELIWKYTTPEYGRTQLDRTSEIGLNKGQYYFVQDRAVVALDASTGDVLWINDDFGGSGTDVAFGEDAIYLCGYLGPDFYAISFDGETLSRIDCIDDAYFWAQKINVDDSRATVYMYGGPDGYLKTPKEFYIDLSSYEVIYK